jgi:hypothetical protein
MAVSKVLEGGQVAGLTIEGRRSDDRKVADVTIPGRWPDDRVVALSICRVAGLSIAEKSHSKAVKGRRSDDIVNYPIICYAGSHGQDGGRRNKGTSGSGKVHGFLG